MIPYPWYHWKRYFGKLKPMELINTQIEDSLLKLHEARVMQHQYTNEAKYQEELLDLLYKEKEYHDAILNRSAFNSTHAASYLGTTKPSELSS